MVWYVRAREFNHQVSVLMTLLDVYKAADEHNVTVIGPNSRTVGAAGGWVLGGGHSVLSSVYGLGVDSKSHTREPRG